MNSIASESATALYIQLIAVNGELLAGATGFVLEHLGRAYLITNWHNVTGKDAETERKLDKKEGWTPTAVSINHRSVEDPFGKTVTIVEELYDEDCQPRWLQHRDFESARIDAVALPLTKLDGVRLFPLTVGPNRFTLKVRDRVSIIGYPLDLVDSDGALAVWTDGTIANEPSGSYRSRPFILVDSMTRPGQSGSPVLNIKDDREQIVVDDYHNIWSGTGQRFCELVGVYAGRVDDRADLGRVWKARVLAEIIDQDFG